MKPLNRFVSLVLCAAMLSVFAARHSAAAPAVNFDLDADGEITTADARIVLRISLALEKESDFPPCDMDGSGDITTADARIVLRVSLGIEKSEDYSGGVIYNDAVRTVASQFGKVREAFDYIDGTTQYAEVWFQDVDCDGNLELIAGPLESIGARATYEWAVFTVNGGQLTYRGIFTQGQHEVELTTVGDPGTGEFMTLTEGCFGTGAYTSYYWLRVNNYGNAYTLFSAIYDGPTRSVEYIFNGDHVTRSSFYKTAEEYGRSFVEYLTSVYKIPYDGLLAKSSDQRLPLLRESYNAWSFTRTDRHLDFTEVASRAEAVF
ncbi:MAG: hypothetical protein K6C36_09280 [Clostridia bacterium]|nr:hypothetical protein [Clostridia bacterium]